MDFASGRQPFSPRHSVQGNAQQAFGSLGLLAQFGSLQVA